MLQLASQATMSSNEMSSLTSIRHDSVMRTIKSLLDSNILTATNCGSYIAGNGQEQPCYNSDKRDSLIIVARLSPEFTAAVIDRWQELENNNPKLPTTYKAALLALVAAEEERERLELENINLTTVVDDLTDWSSIIRIAKHNGVSEKVFKWRLLKAKSLELGYAVKQVPSARYDYQNLYHLNSFRACYPQFDYNLNREILK